MITTVATKTITVSRVSRDSEGRPTWTVEVHDPDAAVSALTAHLVDVTRTYRTGPHGMGVWEVVGGGRPDRQVVGTSQYSHGRRPALLAAMDRLHGIYTDADA